MAAEQLFRQLVDLVTEDEHGNLRQKGDPSGGNVGVAARDFIDDGLRYEQLKSIPDLPPFARELLVRRHDDVAIRRSRQVTDNRSLDVRLRFH